VTATVARLPVVRKRGPKVRTGPCASVVEFPNSLVSRWIAYFMIGARPDDTPGEHERNFRLAIEIMFQNNSPEELRENLMARIQHKREELQRQLAALDRI